MLSRIAESLYWIGRYAERAEDSSRLLDVHLTLLVEDPWAPEEAVCASLLDAMGHDAPPGVPISSELVLERLVWDRTGTGSILGALGAARENARRCRQVISAELWENINVTWHETRRTVRRNRPHQFFKLVRERSAAFLGTVETTLSRDEPYYFLTLGRHIERADMTARLVAARALAGPAGPSWGALLQSCGAYQSFLRSAQGMVEDRRAVEFLLLDPLFPRSLMTSLVAAEQCLDALSMFSHRRARGSEAHRALGAIRAELEFAPTGRLIDDLYPLMERVQGACSAASDAVTAGFFPQHPNLGWAVS
jgi:uncharacterized alpha-E superfamily protein